MIKSKFENYSLIKLFLWIILFIYFIYHLFNPKQNVLFIPIYIICLGIYDFLGALYFKRAMLRIGSSKKNYRVIGFSTMLLQFSIAYIIYQKIIGKENYILGYIILVIPFLLFAIIKIKEYWRIK